MGNAASAMHAAARRFERAPAQLARVGAEALSEALDRQLARDTNGDGRLSNLARRASSPEVEVRSDYATVTAAGAVWAILESGTKAHTIAAQRGRESRALRIDGAWRTGPVRVRGVRGKRTYSRGVQMGTPDAYAAQREEWKRIAHG